jgi:hypothetical protein
MDALRTARIVIKKQPVPVQSTRPRNLQATLECDRLAIRTTSIYPMDSGVRRISLAFHDSRSSGVARLWVEPAAKIWLIRQTVPTAQIASRRKNLPASSSDRSFNEIPAGRPTSNPQK